MRPPPSMPGRYAFPRRNPESWGFWWSINSLQGSGIQKRVSEVWASTIPVYRAADNLAAVDVSPFGSAVRMGTPHALFHATGIRGSLGPYTVTADGKQFLVNSGDVKEESQPLTLVQNWPAEKK